MSSLQRILPEPRDTQGSSHSRHSRFKHGALTLMDTWLSMQVSHYGGKYSLERALALEEYIQRTSFSRVLLTVAWAPAPVILLVLCQESVPLQNPAEGWKANYGFWVRVGIQGSVIAWTLSVHAANFLGEFNISLSRLALYSLCAGAAYTGLALGIAANWLFPLPFLHLLLMPVTPVLVVLVFGAVIGADRFRLVTSRTAPLRQLGKMFAVQLLMTIVYPVYEIAFRYVSGSVLELPVVLLLSLVKIAMKNLITFTVLHMEDLVPEEVIFNVEFFNAAYMATCMQVASSVTTVLGVIAVDIVDTVIELRDLHQRTRRIFTRYSSSRDISQELPTLVRTWAQHTTPYAIRDIIQVMSSCPHRVSDRGKALLKNLQTIPEDPTGLEQSTGTPELPAHPRTRRATPCRCDIRRAVPVHPASMAKDILRRISARLSKHHDGNSLGEPLELLFTSECLVLTEYLETIVPLMYGCGVFMMAHLPAAQYHSEMDGITLSNVYGKLLGVFAYGLLELGSFVALAVVLRRNCGISALYQLGFVLETQMPLVQAKFLLWVVMLLACRVAHFGVDFTFRFAWASENQ